MPIAGTLPPRLGGTGRTLRVTVPIFAALLAALPLMHVVSPSIGLLALCAFLFGVFNILVDVPMNAHASVVRFAGAGNHVLVPCGLERRRAGRRGHRRAAHRSWRDSVGAAWRRGGDNFRDRVRGELPDRRRRHAKGPASCCALPERRLVALGAIAFLAVFAEPPVNDWSTLTSARTSVSPRASRPAGYSAYALMMFLGLAFGDGVVHRLGRTRVLCGRPSQSWRASGWRSDFPLPLRSSRILPSLASASPKMVPTVLQRQRRRRDLAVARDRHGPPRWPIRRS